MACILYNNNIKIILYLLIVFLNITYAESGGELTAGQAAYDVKYYNLNLNINPESRSIEGSLLCSVQLVSAIDTLVFDLQKEMNVDSVKIKIGNTEFFTAKFIHHITGILLVEVTPQTFIGDIISVKVFYHGVPRISKQPPWDDGFVWKTTPSGKTWAGVACETEGADIWFPCKDHPSDEPDSVTLSFTIPNPLQCISNGKYLGSVDNGNGTSTYNWFVSTPINNYNITFYAAEFKLIEETRQSIIGNPIPFYFWVLPESYDQALAFMHVFRNEFNFLEKICGPFPFGTDKLGFAHAPYWGMEHQTIVAYGHDFSLNSWGYDYIHFHELAHEWWGNLITARDWSDVWIHEGIATYTEALYVEQQKGKQALYQFMDMHRVPGINPAAPLAPRGEYVASYAFNNLNPYNRGAGAVHTLRFYLGDELFFKVLKGWAYPDSNNTDNTNGRLCRIVSTDDMRDAAEKISGVELDNFFEVFFRQRTYPTLKVARGDKQTTLTWSNSGNVPMDIDVPVRINGTDHIIEMSSGSAVINISKSDQLQIDPDKWILLNISYITDVKSEDLIINYELHQNYPNPFNPVTKIQYTLPFLSNVKLTVMNSIGEVVMEIKDTLLSGYQEFQFDGSDLPSGVYIYTLEAEALEKKDSFKDSKKMTLLK